MSDASKLDDERKRAEIDKLVAEAAATRRGTGMTWTSAIPLFIGVATIITAVSTAVFQWQLRDVQVERARLESQQEAIKAREETVSAREELLQVKNEAEASQQKADELAQNLEDLQERKDALSTEIDQRVIQLENARKEFEELEEKIQMLAGHAGPNAESALRSAAADAGNSAEMLSPQNSIVYLQFRGEVAREKVRGLQPSLQGAGYSIPGIERVDGSYETEVRYFRDQDRASAEELAEKVKDYLTDTCGYDRGVPTVRPGGTSSALEVWISVNCPG